MAFIPAGPFQMGDNLDGTADAMPVHIVQVDAFFMDKYEVAKELWQAVQTWANNNGYSINGGSFKDDRHPAHSMTWYDAVKWCNARSQKEGLTPCYYTDAAQTVTYKSGYVVLDNTMVKWTANGYRLPTEAEWEKAACGGATGLRFPWGNTIGTTEANYSFTENPWAAGSSPYCRGGAPAPWRRFATAKPSTPPAWRMPSWLSWTTPILGVGCLSQRQQAGSPFSMTGWKPILRFLLPSRLPLRALRLCVSLHWPPAGAKQAGSPFSMTGWKPILRFLLPPRPPRRCVLSPKPNIS